jgi:hypothetical protein
VVEARHSFGLSSCVFRGRSQRESAHQFSEEPSFPNGCEKASDECCQGGQAYSPKIPEDHAGFPHNLNSCV